MKEFIAQGPTGSSVGRWSDFEMDIFDLKAGPRAIKLLSGDLSKDLSDANTLHVLNRLGFLASLGKSFEAWLLVLISHFPQMEG